MVVLYPTKKTPKGDVPEVPTWWKEMTPDAESRPLHEGGEGHSPGATGPEGPQLVGGRVVWRTRKRFKTSVESFIREMICEEFTGPNPDGRLRRVLGWVLSEV